MTKSKFQVKIILHITSSNIQLGVTLIANLNRFKAKIGLSSFNNCHFRQAFSFFSSIPISLFRFTTSTATYLIDKQFPMFEFLAHVEHRFTILPHCLADVYFVASDITMVTGPANK